MDVICAHIGDGDPNNLRFSNLVDRDTLSPPTLRALYQRQYRREKKRDEALQ